MTKEKLVALVETLECAGFEVISLKEETYRASFASGDDLEQNDVKKSGVIAFEIIAL